MGEEPASRSAGQVFLSYASQDAVPAERIAAALRAAGIEVWFDRSELRGGDAWDRRIREQIRDCRLFIPVISANTEARTEGYFRREWRLAVERAGDMAEHRAFLVPVVIDATSQRDASVPDKFRERQWTQLPHGETPAGFTAGVQRLLAGEPPTRQPSAPVTTPNATKPQPAAWPRALPAAAIGLAALALVSYLALEKPWVSRSAPAAKSSAADFSPPPHSIAVLPFVNMSGDKDQEYFSEGLTEELLDSLSRINGLQVAARTSSFSFQGEHVDIATVAHRLNVGAVLEGSVRKSQNTVRVTAQLVNGASGFHIWSESYDRPLTDVLKLQSDIATSVASALKVTLLGDEAAKIELGGTRNPAALDTYLRTYNFYLNRMRTPGDLETAINGFTEATRLDPHYALAFSGRALARLNRGTADDVVAAQEDARQAIALAPQLGEAHLALAAALETALDFPGATEAFEQALALAPGSERVQRHYGLFAVMMGHTEAGLAAARRATAIDPLNSSAYGFLANALLLARRYQEAIAPMQRAIELTPDIDVPMGAYLAEMYYLLGDYQAARSACQRRPIDSENLICAALLQARSGRRAEAERALQKHQEKEGDADAYGHATVYAQWGNAPQALAWLDRAVTLKDSGLARLKTDPLLDPLRNEPHFRQIEQALRFPQ